MNEQQDEFERRARAAFDASVEAIDAETRSRLNRARQAALEQLAARRAPLWRSWAPVGAMAAAVVAVVLWRAPGHEPASQIQVNGTPIEAVELVAEGDDLDLVSEDLEFYSWVADQAGASLSNGVG